jgi:two-component system invasion response regulator UvrY
MGKPALFTHKMSKEVIRCVVLADRHHGISEGIRNLLEGEFEAVVMVADEISLIESASRLHPSLVVADLALTQGEGFDWLRRFLAHCPGSRVIVLSSHDEQSVMEGAFEAGAAGFVRRRDIGSDLPDAVETVLAGRQYVPLQKSVRSSTTDPTDIKKN